MAYDFPLPDIERARTIIDALGAMVVGEPCPSCSGHCYRTHVDARTGARRLVDCGMCAGFGVVGGVTKTQGEAIAALFEGDKAIFELLDERPGHWAIAGSGPERYTDYCGREWHWKLRQARNTCERFFERLEEDACRRAPHSAEGSR